MLNTVRSRVVSGAFALALVGGAGFAATNAFAADPAPARGWCVKSGTGELRNLWFDPDTGKCPAPYWGPVSLGSGTAGPAGPKGDPGDSRLVFANGTRSTAAGTAGDGVLVVSVAGLPPFSVTQARRAFVDVNGESLSTGVTASVGPATATPGATTWNFPVTIAGQTAATPAQSIRIDVMAAPVS